MKGLSLKKSTLRYSCISNLNDEEKESKKYYKVLYTFTALLHVHVFQRRLNSLKVFLSLFFYVCVIFRLRDFRNSYCFSVNRGMGIFPITLQFNVQRSYIVLSSFVLW